MRLQIFLTAYILFILPVSAQQVNIIPQPASVELKKGTFTISSNTYLLALGSGMERSVSFLNGYLKQCYGFQLKKEISGLLEQLGHKVEDLGSYTEESCDYPPIACRVASATAKSRNARGILVCMTGIGHSIAANKIPGAFAALCYNKEAAALSRQHNNSNVLVVGAKFVPPEEMQDLVKIWLETKFEGGRHLRRVKQIKQIEKTRKCS